MDLVNVFYFKVSWGPPPGFNFLHDFCCLSQDGEASVLLLTGQKWVNVIMLLLHWRNPSPAQQQGNVLLTNPQGTLLLLSSNSSPLCSLIFLSSQFTQIKAQTLLLTTCCPSLSKQVRRQTHRQVQVYASRIIYKVQIHVVSSSPVTHLCISHTNTHTHKQSIFNLKWRLAYKLDPVICLIYCRHFTTTINLHMSWTQRRDLTQSQCIIALTYTV